MARKCNQLFLVCILLTAYFCNVNTAFESTKEQYARVHKFTMDDNLANSEHERITKRDTRQQSVREKRETTDATCKLREQSYLQDVKSENFISMHTFSNETKYAMALVWAGIHDGVILVVTTEEKHDQPVPSSLYRSINSGKNFENINSRVGEAYIRKDNGLQKHAHQQATVYIIAHSKQTNSLMYRTTDGGATNFTEIQLPFTFIEQLVFHPDSQHAKKLLARSTQKDLFISTNNGDTWNKIKDNVRSFKWSTMPNEEEHTIYITYGQQNGGIFDILFPSEVTLMKTKDLGQTWDTIHEDIYTFGMQGKFLFTSVISKENSELRLMEVSTDGGNSWAEAQLPSITEDRFYSILDMSEGIIFMHVDNPGDTGHGTLYVSDQTGIIFAESLQNHLYPNYIERTDFYRVKSMRGTYMASQLEDSDESIHTVVSFDRGAEWRNVTRPSGVPCKDENKACFLQIHNQYSQMRGVNAKTPLSVESAIGIILVHGHVADALQTTEPDVYVSSDGGYTWTLALNKPHDYQIADNGGLLVAVPAVQHISSVKFSTDEGRCWHEYHFTNESIVFTGLLTEPGNQEMTVAIFGYGTEDREWRTFVIDFEVLIANPCYDNDYQDWIPHMDNSKDEKFQGCLLGKKESYRRLKKDSWCKNGNSYNVTSSIKVDSCDCTKDDYDCDYGYHRVVGSSDCVKDGDFVGPDIDICLRGHEEQIVTTGYRKIPGDVCKGGFSPKGDSLLDMNKLCNEESKDVQKEELGVIDWKQLEDERDADDKKNSVLIISSVLVTLLLTVVVIAFLVRKYKLMSRVPNIRYGLLQTEPDFESQIEDALGAGTSLYEDDSDEEEAARGGGSAFRYGNTNKHTSYGGTVHSPLSAPPSNASAPTTAAVGKQPKSFHDDSDVDMLE